MLLFKQKGDNVCQIDCLKSVQASLQLVFKWRSATQCYNLLLQLHQHIIQRGNTQNDVEDQVWDSATLIPRNLDIWRKQLKGFNTISGAIGDNTSIQSFKPWTLSQHCSMKLVFFWVMLWD